jgi:ribosomal subunit interface protein
MLSFKVLNIMLVNIQARNFDLAPELNDYVESKIRLMLGRYKNKIMKINVTLSHVNSPREREVKCCEIIIMPKIIPTIVIQETAADIVDAVNNCSHRAKRIVSRNLRFTQWNGNS